jgi:hypothetical protein
MEDDAMSLDRTALIWRPSNWLNFLVQAMIYGTGAVLCLVLGFPYASLIALVVALCFIDYASYLTRQQGRGVN